MSNIKGTNVNQSQPGSVDNEEIGFLNKTKSIDLSKIVSANFKLWWVTLLCVILLASAGFAAARMTYVETYTSCITFIASNTSSEDSPTRSDDTTVITKDYLSSSDVTASQNLTNTFVYVLTSDNLMNNCIRQLDISGMFPTAASLKRCISVEATDGTQKLDLRVTTTDADVSRDVATEIMNNYEEVLKSVLPNTSLKVLDEPYKATSPDGNNNTLIYTALGAVAGLILSVFFISLKEMLSNTIVDVEDITHQLGLRILGIVPGGKVKKSGKNTRKASKDFSNRLITDPGCEFSYRETFKSIRTKIIKLSREKGYKTFVVTSTIANEGKTTVSVNTALALSQAGKSVLLIDGDIRKPSIDRILGIKNDTNYGLTNVINGKAKLEDSIFYIEDYNVCVILAGEEVDNPSELLAGDELKNILAAAEKEFDYVIIDSSPANLVTDSCVIGQYVDATVLVVRQKHARTVDVRYIVEDMINNGLNIVGCVFNGVDRLSSVYNRYYGYYGYGDKNAKTQYKSVDAGGNMNKG